MLWLGATGPTSNQPFGGRDGVRLFWDRFIAELRLFICGDSAYEKERKELLQSAKGSVAVLVPGVSALIGSKLGVPTALLAPAVALMLYVIGKAGVNAWCKA